jgi:competence protein ComEA
MKVRIALVAAVLVLIGLAFWRPVRRVPFQTVQADTPASPVPLASVEPGGRRRHGKRRAFAAGRSTADEGAVVYVVGAVRRPGLYQLRAGSRIADAVRAAGGLTPGADPAGINLAAHLADGDEVDAPVLGAAPRAVERKHRTRRRATPSPETSVDVNAASASELASVPGLGRSIAARIVEMRERDGPFTSLDELLDVAGMTQARLERAQAFLQSP